jgi:hypothetical protein
MTTIRWRWIAVAVLCCLLTLATSASAESGWILWAQLISVAGDDNVPNIAVVALGVWPSQEDCVQHQQKIAGRRLPGTEKETIGAVYVCLPDHVNLMPGR